MSYKNSMLGDAAGSKAGKNSGYALPDQFISTTRKGKTWRENCADYFSEKSFLTTRFSKRKSTTEMHRNWRILYGDLNYEDMMETFDPLGVNRDDPESLPENIVSYNPLKKGFRTLFNEERKRKNDVRAVAINPEIISQKDFEFKEKFAGFLQELEQQYQQGNTISDEDIKKGLEELDFYRKHDLQSAHETMANQLLEWFRRTPDHDVDNTFNKGFQDLTVIGEEIYEIRNQGGMPYLSKVKNDRFIALGVGNQDRIEEGWAWISWDFQPLNKVLEELAGDLTRKEIDELQKTIETYHQSKPVYELADVSISTEQMGLAVKGEPFFVDEHGRLDQQLTNKYVDEDGNILVVRFQWVSFRKIGKLTYIDEDGSQITDLVDEYYKPREDMGETIEWIWIPELWEGMKIGESVYKNIQPSETQMRSNINPAKVRPRYVGTVLSYGDGGTATSVMDDLIPWKRDFDLTMNKLRKLWSRHMGNIIRISKSMIPPDMDDTKWYKWLSALGILWEDDFNMDPNSGAFAGNMQARTPVLSMSAAEDINAAILQLQYIQSQIDNYMSTPPSRTGELQGNEGLGVTQQAIIGATLSTEDLYAVHEKTMVRVYEVLLEFTKNLWADEDIQQQYILDDLSQQVLKYDSQTMLEAEFGVIMTNSSDLRDVQRNIEIFGQAMAQNGTIAYSDLIAMQGMTSTGAAQRKMQAAEEKKRREMIENDQRQAELQAQAAEQQLRIEERKHEMELEKIRLKGEYELEKERLRAEFNAVNGESRDDNGNGVEDIVEIQTETIKAQAAKDIERMRIQQADKEHKDDIKLKSRELDIKNKEVQAKAKAAARPTTN